KEKKTQLLHQGHSSRPRLQTFPWALTRLCRHPLSRNGLSAPWPRKKKISLPRREQPRARGEIPARQAR
ncbi:unnamed protein product, partial [Lampetra planeri]